MKLFGYIISISLWVIVISSILIILSICAVAWAFFTAFFSIALAIKILSIALLVSIFSVAFIYLAKYTLEYAIEASEEKLTSEIARLHKEMDAIIEQFKKDKGE